MSHSLFNVITIYYTEQGVFDTFDQEETISPDSCYIGESSCHTFEEYAQDGYYPYFEEFPTPEHSGCYITIVDGDYYY